MGDYFMALFRLEIVFLSLVLSDDDDMALISSEPSEGQERCTYDRVCGKQSIGVYYSLENFDDMDKKSSGANWNEVDESSLETELASRACSGDDRRRGVDRSSETECAKASREARID